MSVCLSASVVLHLLVLNRCRDCVGSTVLRLRPGCYCCCCWRRLGMLSGAALWWWSWRSGVQSAGEERRLISCYEDADISLSLSLPLYMSLSPLESTDGDCLTIGHPRDRRRASKWVQETARRQSPDTVIVSALQKAFFVQFIHDLLTTITTTRLQQMFV